MRKNRQPTVRQHLAVTGALLATTVLGGAASPTFGQAQQIEGNGDTKGTSSLRVTQSVMQPPHKFDIPAGSISDAIKAFELATGMDVRVRIMTLRGLTTDAVQGEMSAEQALRKILAKTDIVYRFLDTNTVMLLRGRNHRDAASHELDAVSVTGKKAAGHAVASPKYTEPVRDIPQSITVVSQEVLKQQNVTSLRDAVRNVAGITMNAGENGGMPGDKFNLRGFSAASDIYVDGVRDIGGYSREAYNLEQVEVTKGPNGAYSGRGSTGGTINLVTKTPQANDRRSADITLGSADQRRATVDINQTLAPIGFEGAAIRINAMNNTAGVAGNDVIRNKGWGVAPSLAIGLNSRTQFLLQYNRSVQDNIPSYGIETFAQVPTFDTRKFYGLRSLDFEKVDANQTIARVEHRLSDKIQLRNQTTRGHTDVRRIVTSAVPIATNPDSARRSPKTHINDNIVVANQTNLTATFNTGPVEHTVVSGLEFTGEKAMFGRYTITGTNPAISNLNNPTADADYHPTLAATVARRVKASGRGAYLFETMKPHAKVELTAGLRWDQYKPEYTDSASKASGFKAAKSRAVTGRGGVVFKPVEDASLYASYGTSFNPSNENLSADALNVNSKLPPEKTRSYELGAKWDLFKQRLLSTVAFFRTDKVNARTTDPTNTTLQILDGKQRVQGAEAGVTGDIMPSLNVLANYSFMESKYLKSNTASQTNKPFTNVPKHSANAWATYKIVPGVSLGGGARFVGKRLLRLTDTTRVDVPSYAAFDVMASYKVNSTIDLQLNLYNLTDKLYYDSGRMWVPAAGRAVSVTTSMKF